ncbi:MAG TPA: YerC/YecD family TrpR-related protein [Clostridia bacterium]|nr:YerC/YecD family TrpR-related protein [Clostridia bacterium]
MKYKSKLRNQQVDELFDAVLELRDLEECYRFFEDICTINEVKSLAQRLGVAKMLRAGRTYQDIADETGASTATISRVNRSLTYGADGYNIILDRLLDK